MDVGSMPQLSLLFPSPSVLVDDHRGRISYEPAFLAPDLAGAWFHELRESVAWKAERRRMYDRDVDVPRLTAHFRLGPEAGLPPSLRTAASRVAAHLDVPFNSVGLNLYRDGRDSVAPHNDHLDVLVPGHPIALLSLGSARRMTIRAKKPPRRVLHLDLEPGSLLVMSWATQLHYTHGIPKVAEVVGERISLAFRVKPAGEPGPGDPYD
jgi:alkylated DNA repair dioxygenase AlkB